jgi:predicted lipoprotein with Yx(FWY)xxD motif
MKSPSLRRARRVAQLTLLSALTLAVTVSVTDTSSAASKKKKSKKAVAATTTAPVTAAPTTAAPTTVAPAAPLFGVAKSQVGDILVASSGRSLYMFDPDARKPGGSVCNGQCADVWPPIIVKSEAALVAPSGFGGKLTAVKRDDGSLQAAVNGWPIYGWVFDKSKGDLNGQAVNEVWWVLDPTGNPIRTTPTMRIRSNKVGAAAASKNVLVDARGMTLYMFENDKVKDVSACYDACATAWPPALVTSEAQLSLFQGGGLDRSKLKLIRRADTTALQVSYNGWPLYTWVRDVKIGDTTGQAVGNVWWVIDATGTPQKT